MALLLVCFELKSDSFSYRIQVHSIPKLQRYQLGTPISTDQNRCADTLN